jgi:hypothetical protein
MNPLVILVLLFIGFGIYGVVVGGPLMTTRAIPHPSDEEGRRRHVRRVLVRLPDRRRRAQNRATFPF